MPITRELDNIRKFEAAGFDHKQSETLADVIEQSHADGHETLKEFIHGELDSFRKDVRNEISSLELRIKASLTDLLLKIFAIVVGCTSIAIAVVKVLG